MPPILSLVSISRDKGCWISAYPPLAWESDSGDLLSQFPLNHVFYSSQNFVAVVFFAVFPAFVDLFLLRKKHLFGVVDLEENKIRCVYSVCCLYLGVLHSFTLSLAMS